MDATKQVLRVGDEVSFHATSYTAGGTGTVKRFTATFIIIRWGNGGEICRALVGNLGLQPLIPFFKLSTGWVLRFVL